MFKQLRDLLLFFYFFFFFCSEKLIEYDCTENRARTGDRGEEGWLDEPLIVMILISVFPPQAILSQVRFSVCIPNLVKLVSARVRLHGNVHQ